MPRSPPSENSGPCTATHTTFEFRGSTAILPMCSDLSSPTRFQDLPASVDLYNPVPKCALRWLLFSPVPSQMTFESLGSTTTQQREKASTSPMRGKTSSKLMPRFAVFHNPPNAEAMYQVFG